MTAECLFWAPKVAKLQTLLAGFADDCVRALWLVQGPTGSATVRAMVQALFLAALLAVATSMLATIEPRIPVIVFTALTSDGYDCTSNDFPGFKPLGPTLNTTPKPKPQKPLFSMAAGNKARGPEVEILRGQICLRLS